MTPNNCEIVDWRAFCEVIFFCISAENLLGDFFDSLGRNRWKAGCGIHPQLFALM
jgi:hypothetical protein